MKIKEIFLGAAIAILTIFVSFYLINSIFPKPQYTDFCSSYPEPRSLEREICPAVCVPMYKISRGSCRYEECGSGCGPDNITTFSTLSECELELYNLKCSERYDFALKTRSRNVFFVAIPLGIILLIFGSYFFKLESVGAGLMAGGLGTLIYGSGAYWPYTENIIRFFISLLGLILLISLAYYFNKKINKKIPRKIKFRK
ncbi:MAG: hypothetical protein KatS3mg001_187 [Candidatus Pacearchaeota archaeon]|nr:MAG: hypothetical protein KatS3mg001_187 [Candidatus Pacearchaeota archaeon]